MALRNGGLFAVRPTDADGLDDVDGSASCNWTGWASARYLFPVNTSAMIEARACMAVGWKASDITATANTIGYLRRDALAGKRGRLHCSTD